MNEVHSRRTLMKAGLAVALPVGFEDGAPISCQIIGPATREDICYRVARDFQRATEFQLKHPG